MSLYHFLGYSNKVNTDHLQVRINTVLFRKSDFFDFQQHKLISNSKISHF